MTKSTLTKTKTKSSRNGVAFIEGDQDIGLETAAIVASASPLGIISLGTFPSGLIDWPGSGFGWKLAIFYRRQILKNGGFLDGFKVQMDRDKAVALFHKQKNSTCLGRARTQLNCARLRAPVQDFALQDYHRPPCRHVHPPSL
jgi:hypothetical protein